MPGHADQASAASRRMRGVKRKSLHETTRIGVNLGALVYSIGIGFVDVDDVAHKLAVYRSSKGHGGGATAEVLGLGRYVVDYQPLAGWYLEIHRVGVACCTARQ